MCVFIISRFALQCQVESGRVNGLLEVSRSLGDLRYQILTKNLSLIKKNYEFIV
jgi:hypothetical protein